MSGAVRMTTRKDQLQNMLRNDPLYKVIVDTPLEEELYQEPWLDSIIEKKYYSTPEIAEWFGITDGQLRYYIKPFQEYLFSSDVETPSSASAYRLNLSSILRLRMIVMLKDEYRVKGLQRLIGINGAGYVEKRPKFKSTQLAKPDQLEKKVESLQNLIEQIMKTGIFQLHQGEEGPSIVLRDDLKIEHVQRLQETIEANSNTLLAEKEFLRKEISEIEKNRKDIAVLWREKRIEESLTAELRTEALVCWNNEHKPSMFKRMLKPGQIEIQKEKYIQDYIRMHLNERLNEALRDYHEVVPEGVIT